MRIPPTEVLLTFPTPNYTNPETRGPALVIINGVFIALTVIVVALRVYTRVVITRLIGWDDIFCVIGLLFTIGLTVSVLLANQQYHWNRHVWDVPFARIPELGKIAMVAKIMFTLAATFIRFSLMCFYYRLVGYSGLKGFRLVVHGAMVFNLIVGVGFLLTSIFMCSPVSAYWAFPATGTCLNEGKMMIGWGIVNCFADLLVTVLPIPMIMNLKMRFRKKLAVVLLLSLGFIVTIAGVFRTYFIYKSLVETWDETWYAYPLYIAAAVEIDLAVITSCAPALRPFFSIYFGALMRPTSMLSKDFATTEGSTRPHKPGSSTTSLRGLDQKSKEMTVTASEIEMKATVYESDPAHSDSRVPIMAVRRDEADVDQRRSPPRKSHRSTTSSLFSRMGSRRERERERERNYSTERAVEDNPPLRIYRRQSFELSTTTSPRSQSPFSPLPNPGQQPRLPSSRERGHTVPGGSQPRRPSDDWPFTVPNLNGVPGFLQRDRTPNAQIEGAGTRTN